MVTAKPVGTTSVECGGRRKVLLYSPGLSTGRSLTGTSGGQCGQLKHQYNAGDALMEKLVLTVREAADLLSVSRSRLHELLYAEQLDSVKIGRFRRVSPASVRFGRRPVTSITTGDVSNWLGDLMRRGLARSTATRALATLRSLLSFAVADGRVTVNAAAAAKAPTGGQAPREGQVPRPR